MKTHIALGTTWLLVLPLVLSAASCGSTTNGSDSGGSQDMAGGGGLAINGCTSTAYVDRTPATADRTVSFGTQNGSPAFGYAPQCITITAGQSVTFAGSFVAHPLSPGSSPTNLTSGSPSNPIARVSTGSTTMVTFPTAGTYPYFCENHYAAGMTGAVQVR